MAKRIIILSRDVAAPRPTFSVAFWMTVPAAQQAFRADPTRESAYKSATAEEVGALRDGTVVERVETISMPPGATLAQIAAALQDRWTALQAEITADKTFERYGTNWDGTSWTQLGSG